MEERENGLDIVELLMMDAARLLGSTYIEILQTRTFMEEVSKDIDEQYEWDEVLEMTTISSISDTELLKISVTADTPANANRHL